VFANGKPAIFVSGVYRTDIDWEIAELDKEVKSGHPHIYVDSAEATIESEMVDPMNALRAKIIAEFVASQEAATNPDNDMGKSTQGAVIPANSRDIASAAAGGSGEARLVNLPKKS